MTSPSAPDSAPVADPLDLLIRILGVGGLVALALITMASPGATRVFSLPWSRVYGFTLLVPAVIVLLRAFDPRRPLVLPGSRWLGLGLGGMIILLLSATFSPYAAPSLLCAAPLLSLLATFFVVFDWLHAALPETLEARRVRLLGLIGIFLAVIAVASMGLWLLNLPESPTGGGILDARNPFPLGHSNYTAGLALLMLPCFGALAWRSRGAGRAGWLGAVLLTLAMLFTSGSRGGLAGLAVLLLAFIPTIARALRLKPWLIVAGGILLLAAVVGLNPRLRAMIQRDPPGTEPNLSNVQRSAMLSGGIDMGKDRPLLGWGPGTTPLVYPRYRAQLDGGAENVLQLHSTPVQLWAELGAAGLIGALALAGLTLHAAWSSPVARSVLLAFSGYAVFSLTDWQFDVPVFGFALAVAMALAASPGGSPLAGRTTLAGVTFAALAALFFAGRRDTAPELNLRALDLARNAGQAHRAVTFLNESLALNPDQEIVHFNLGWLLVVSDPATAESHFLAAAHLVPDKGGVYFGLGLARLNQGRRDASIRAFALECINDPLFLTSPWWRQPAFAALQPAAQAEALRLIARARSQRVIELSFAAGEADYLAALIPWLEGKGNSAEILAKAHTAERARYFASQPAPPNFAAAPVVAYRRERTGYPVLMRNLDLPPPTDLFDVQENTLAARDFRFLFPHKGWLPGPLAILLLEERNPSP